MRYNSSRNGTIAIAYVKEGRTDMAFCKNCGAQIADGTTTCPSCGAPQDNYNPNPAPNYNNNYNPNYNNYNPNYNPNPPAPDNGGFLWGLLGCCIPLVGLILFLVWKDQKPRTAKAAGIGALVGVGLVVVWYILVFAIGIGSSLMY